jgi:hypothetical protein
LERRVLKKSFRLTGKESLPVPDYLTLCPSISSRKAKKSQKKYFLPAQTEFLPAETELLPAEN